MSDPEKDKEPAPAAPKLGELFELAATALFNAPGVFARLEARPAPGPGAAFLMALAWGVLFIALNLMHATIANPAALRAYAPWQIGAVGFFGLGLWTALYLLGASLVYGLGRALGSAGDFDRALLVAAITLAAAPAQALCSWFPMAWAAPTVVAAWMLACGLSAMFKADPWAARGVCAALAAGVLGLQYGAGLVVEKYSAGAQLAAVAAQSAPSASQLAELQQQMQQIQTAVEEAPKANPPGPSSLDLLRGPAAEEAPPAGPTDMQQIAKINASGDAMNKSMVTMLDSMAPMLNNPLITKNMTLQQKSDYNELKTMLSDLKAGIASNTITSPQEQQAKMLKIQQLVMRMMSAGMTMPPPQAAPAPGARK
ncbi:MAG: Yip1 family protein [Elusimicrobia bacterium]|nr:Yip1 family protein [Elusimicrobiota bacterium]